MKKKKKKKKENPGEVARGTPQLANRRQLECRKAVVFGGSVGWRKGKVKS